MRLKLENTLVRTSALLAFAVCILVQVFCLGAGLEAWTPLSEPLALSAAAVLFLAPIAASIMAATAAILVFEWHWLFAAAMPASTLIVWTWHRTKVKIVKGGA